MAKPKWSSNSPTRVFLSTHPSGFPWISNTYPLILKESHWGCFYLGVANRPEVPTKYWLVLPLIFSTCGNVHLGTSGLYLVDGRKPSSFACRSLLMMKATAAMLTTNTEYTKIYLTNATGRMLKTSHVRKMYETDLIAVCKDSCVIYTCGLTE